MTDEISQKEISTKRLKSFVRHLCIISKKHKEREDARAELEEQMGRLKRFSSKKKEMDEELEELNDKISLVLEKEAQLMGVKQGDGSASKELMNEVMRNRDNINSLHISINELRKLLQHYTHVKLEREKRIEELEKKIKDKVKKKKDVTLLKAKLKKLEQLSNKMKRKGINIKALEHKIEGLKLRLSVL